MLSEKNVISDLDCELQVKPHNNIRYIQQGSDDTPALTALSTEQIAI